MPAPVEIVPPEDPKSGRGVRYIYENGIEMIHGGPGGCVFEGTKGTLGADFGKRKILLGGETLTDIASVPKTLPRSPGHQRDFLDCVRSRREPTTGIHYAYAMTVPMCLGRVSFHLRRPIRWDAARERVVGDEPANRLLGRVYREPWVLPA